MSVISKVGPVGDLPSSEIMQRLLQNLESQLSQAKDDGTKLVLTKVINQLKTVKDVRLQESLDDLGWHKLLLWCRFCIERGATNDEDRLLIADEVAERWKGDMGGSPVGYYTWQGIKNAVRGES